ncbi:hypothetical protein HanRHA438_Chr00c13g0849821 [Helianthus annuus]|nr:hypothetical protein HanIR_Chr13g0660301 [Helianthus annuus]KAJ0954562.1 hypothetical protein HanRHA438_Chr00c13g0849821 [Helianthus annuus]
MHCASCIGFWDQNASDRYTHFKTKIVMQKALLKYFKNMVISYYLPDGLWHTVFACSFNNFNSRSKRYTVAN